MLPAPVTKTMVIKLAMIFAQRFMLSLKTRDMNTIRIGISSSIAKTNNNSSVTFIPVLPAIIPANTPGFINPTISAKIILNSTTIHNVDSLALLSSIREADFLICISLAVYSNKQNINLTPFLCLFLDCY